jgi:hypothetical protein
MRGLKGGEACYLRCCKMVIKSDEGELWLGGVGEMRRVFQKRKE